MGGARLPRMRARGSVARARGRARAPGVDGGGDGGGERAGGRGWGIVGRGERRERAGRLGVRELGVRGPWCARARVCWRPHCAAPGVCVCAGACVCVFLVGEGELLKVALGGWVVGRGRPAPEDPDSVLLSGSGRAGGSGGEGRRCKGPLDGPYRLGGTARSSGGGDPGRWV